MNLARIEKIVQNSEIYAVSFAVILSITSCLVASVIYIVNSPLVKNPVYEGVAVVEVNNGVNSKVAYEGETVTTEVVNNKKGDKIALYQDGNLYTNNPNGHSGLESSEDSVIIKFGLVALAAGVAGWLMGFFTLMGARNLALKHIKKTKRQQEIPASGRVSQ